MQTNRPGAGAFWARARASLLVVLAIFGIGQAMAGPSTTTLTSNLNPVVVGQNFTLTAGVNGASPTGSVTFKAGTTTLATVTLAAGVATYTRNYTSIGTRSLSAVYNGDANNSTSTSGNLSLVVNQEPTTTALAVAPNPAQQGQPATLTATVTGTNLISYVGFWNGAVELARVSLVGNIATLSNVNLPVGTHSLWATYPGDSNHGLSTSPNVSFSVTPGSITTSTSTLSFAPNPVPAGQNVTLTATVAGSSPTGTVTFQDGATVLGTRTLSAGAAALTTSFNGAGSYGLSASYSGDANNTSSFSSPTWLTVSKANTTTALVPSVNPSGVNQSINLTASVSGVNPTGSVTFRNGTTSLGTATLTAGVATLATTFTTTGARSLSAVYSGDWTNNTSTSATLTQNVLSATTTALTSSVNPSLAGQNSTLRATVTPSTATGSVTFKDGPTTLGTGTLSAGVATLVRSFATAGAHSLTAVYGGNATLGGSISGALNQSVNKANSATTLSASPNPSVTGQSVNLTATVTGVGPSGTVTFRDGATTLGTGTLSAGVATLATTFTTTGTKSLSAVYAGDANNTTSTSAALSQIVNVGATATTTALTSSVNPSAIGQNTTLSATVSPSTATGSVTFRDGATTIGTATLSAGVATLATSFSTTGAHSLSAVYAGGGTFTGSTSAALGQTVDKANSATTLSASPNPSAAGQAITLTANVAGVNPTGTVTFLDGATTLGTGTLSAGVATLSTTFTSPATKSLSASYGGDANNNTSASAALSQVVNKAASTATVALSANPSYEGQSGTVTVTVTGLNPTGTVSFIRNGVTLGTAPLVSGVAVVPIVAPAPATYTFTASYSGDAVNLASTSAPVIGTVLARALTTTTVAANPNPVLEGQSGTLSAGVTATGTNPSPSGSVTFLRDGVAQGSATLSAGVATLAFTALTPGNYVYTASYAGDVPNAPSASAGSSLTVNPIAAPTTTALSASINPASVGQNVTLSAAVTGSSPTGTVSFKDGAATIGSATLSAGVATLVTSFASAGAKSLTATYAGNATNSASTSAALNLVVNLNPSTTALSSTVNPSSVGQSTTLSASVSPATATGSVSFNEGAVTLGTGTITSGTATLVTSFATSGNHILSASYGGDAAHAASTSAQGTQIVNAANTATTLGATPNPATEGANIVLTASVSGGVAPGGSVNFSDGANVIGTAPLASGQASLTTSLYGAGPHSLSASYAGDANHNASSSAALSLVVNGPPPLPPPATAAAPVIDYEYDAQGNRTKVIQAKTAPGFNFATVNTYDSLNRAKDSTDAKLGITRFGYDALDRVFQVTDPRNLVTQTPKNGLGDTTALVSPDTGSASFTYDAAGNLLTRSDSRGVLSTFTYDALNRATGTVYSLGATTQTHTWSYDQTGAGFANGVGRLTSTSHPGGSTQYLYDAQGRVLTDIQRVNAQAGANASQIVNTVSYGYDAAGKVTSIVYPSGRKLSVTYTAGVPSAVSLAKDSSSTAVNLISAIQWEPFGAPRSWLWQLTTGTQLHAREFDSSGRVVRYRLGNYVRDIAYDAADRITGYSHLDTATATATAGASALNQSFGYDELGRLTNIGTGSASWSIGYDANGNRTGVTLNGTPSSYTTATTSNRLDATTNPARNFAYDSAGNTTSDTGSGYTATYDLAGRLATLTKAGITTTYSYNVQGQRVRKFASSGASSTVVFVYDQGGQLLGEYDQSGTAIREYVWLGATPIAMFTPDPVNSASPPLVYYIHTDHIDTPRIVVDRSNNIRWRWLAEPFGTTAPENNPSGLGAFTQNLRFPGQYADSESGLFYNWHREFDSSTGRYTTPDPLGLAGGEISLYAYALNAPTKYTDPHGLYVPPPAIVWAAQATAATLARAAAAAVAAAAGLFGDTPAAGIDNCPPDDDECKKIIAEIYRYMKTVNNRIDDMLADKLNLFNLAYDTPHYSLPKNSGSWQGHYEAADGWQRGLRALIQEALRKNCNVPREAWNAAYRKIPLRPTR